MYKKKFYGFIIPKLKFGMTSSIATAVDYTLYLILVMSLSPVVSNLISAGTGMIINFFLQKRYIFELRRKFQYALAISVLTSLIGIALSTSIIWVLNYVFTFTEYQFIIKGIATGIVFFYNFYMKRFAFEKRLF